MPKPPPSNPAQRLHDILARHADARSTHSSDGYDHVWQQTLGCSDRQLTGAIASAFALITDIDQALEVTRDERVMRSADRHRREWASAFVPPNTGRNQMVGAGPSEESIEALGLIAAHLETHLPEGQIPNSERSAQLREQVRALIDDLRADAAIDEDVRLAMVARLNDIAWALDHAEIGGAGAVQAALDRLVVAYATAEKRSGGKEGEDRERGWSRYRSRVMEVGKACNDLISFPGSWYATYELAAQLSSSLPLPGS